MEQNRPFTAGETGDHPGSEANPVWKKDRKKFSLSELIEKRWKHIIGICVVLIVLGLILLPENKKNPTEDSQKSLEGKISVLASRLDKIEARISSLELAAGGNDQTVLKDRVDQLEAALTSKLDILSKRLDDVHAGVATASEAKKAEPRKPIETEPPKPAATPVTAAPPPPKKTVETPPKPSPSTPKVHIHEVQKGDTVYSIARKYNIKVEDIYQANHMTSSSVIHPGQKLTIYPPKGN